MSPQRRNRGPIAHARVGAETAANVGRQNSAIRMAVARSESWLDSGDQMEIEEESTEFDDAPAIDDLPEWEFEDDDPVLVEDEPRPWEVDLGSRPTWVRLSLFIDHDGIPRQVVHRRASGDPEIDRSLAEVWSKWDTLGATLLRTQAEALRCATRADALRALSSFPMKDLETSEGQGSRDRVDIIDTPFGLVPLWFFGLGRLWKSNTTLHQDLLDTARAAVDQEWDKITEGRVAKAIPRSTTKPGTIARRHGSTLMAVLKNPDVVARHRARWPHTSLAAFKDDLEAGGFSATSEAVRVLALVGELPPDRGATTTAYGRDAIPAAFRSQEE